MSTRDTMLGFAREAILTRARADGYYTGAYDPETDDEGYITSLLTALRHWCDAFGHNWKDELRRAEELFEEDLQEYRETQRALTAG